MDRYRLTGYKSQTHYVRALAGLNEEFVIPQILAEIEAQILARNLPQAVIVIARDRDGWEKIIRASRPSSGTGPFLVQGDFGGDLPS